MRDSGSVRIAESFAPYWGDDAWWFVDSVPTFVAVHSRRDASLTEFQHLLQVQRLGDGSIVVLDMAEPFVRAFGVDGELLWTAVSRGDGPAEIREPALLSRIRGDTLIVEDGQSPKSLMLTPQGKVVGALPSRLVLAPEGIGERLLYPAVRLDDGGLVGYMPVLRRDELEGEGMVVPEWPVYLFARDADSTVSLGSWPFLTMAQQFAPSVHIVFGARAVLAQTPDGFLHGFPSTSELRMYDSDGTIRTVLRIPTHRRLASAEEVSSARSILADVMKNPRLATLRPDEILVDSIPSYGRVVVGTDGVIWRERFDPAAPPAISGLARLDRGAVWEVHEPGGRWLGAVELPPGFYLTDSGQDWVAGIHSDSDDVQTPHVHSLIRRSE